MSLVGACRSSSPAGAIGICNLWKAVKHNPQDRARMQHQDLSLRIVIAFDPTRYFPLSVDEPALLYNAESHVGRPGSIRRKVDAHAASTEIKLIGTGGNDDCSCF